MFIITYMFVILHAHSFHININFNNVMTVHLGHACNLLPARARKQGNVIGLVSVYTCVCTKKL